MENRMLLAFVLMGLVLLVTPYFFPKSQPPPPSKPAPKAAPAPRPAPPPAAPPAAPTPAAAQVSAAAEQVYAIETDLYRIQFSNRGAVVRSWVLKKFVDSTGKPLELINPKGAAKAGFPFSTLVKEPKPSADLNEALYAARPGTDGLSIEFEFSDGKLASRKAFRFARDSYLSRIVSEIAEAGRFRDHSLMWRGGFGDSTVASAAVALHTTHFDVPANELVLREAKEAKDAPLADRGHYSFLGLEDAYFACVLLPPAGAQFEIQTWSDSVPIGSDGKEEPLAGAAVGGQGRIEASLFVGPKDVDLLRRIDPKLEQLVDFGWFSFLARPLFLALNWLNDRYVRNYGWSIVVITVAINFLLLPLKITSLRSMKKMQLLQPQIAAINEKYKGLSLRDPRKANQNQEVMELYRKHGVNPMGGCVPMLLQIPFFIAFYKVLTVAIELRGAQWLWVTDLSQPEHLPIRILPVAMISSQFVLQKMTPSTTADPTQQRVMMLMPLILGFMFYGVSSGLVLYWLTGNLVGIAQQWYFNRTVHAPSPAAATKPAPKKRDSRK